MSLYTDILKYSKNFYIDSQDQTDWANKFRNNFKFVKCFRYGDGGCFSYVIGNGNTNEPKYNEDYIIVNVKTSQGFYNDDLPKKLNSDYSYNQHYGDIVTANSGIYYLYYFTEINLDYFLEITSSFNPIYVQSPNYYKNNIKGSSFLFMIIKKIKKHYPQFVK